MCHFLPYFINSLTFNFQLQKPSLLNNVPFFILLIYDTISNDSLKLQNYIQNTKLFIQTTVNL